MQHASSVQPDCPRIVIADEDPTLVQFVTQTLRADGLAVFVAYDALSATQLVLSLDRCDLLISNTRVEGFPGITLIHEIRLRRPHLPIIYLANLAHSSPELEAKLPRDVSILREPFTAEELRAVVRPSLSDAQH
jgi:DNA-binding response OmpR family regulator